MSCHLGECLYCLCGVTASDALSAYNMPAVLERLREVAPDIEVELLASNVIQTLRRREADIAIRPSGPADLANATFIGMGNIDRMLDGLNALGLSLTRRNFKLSTNSGLAGWEMVKQGPGFGMMSKEVGDVTPGVDVVLPDVVSIEFPVWLTTHRELHSSRRIRLVFDLLAEAQS